MVAPTTFGSMNYAPLGCTRTGPGLKASISAAMCCGRFRPLGTRADQPGASASVARCRRPSRSCAALAASSVHLGAEVQSDLGALGALAVRKSGEMRKLPL